MCGLFGYSGYKKADPLSMKIGLMINQSRGTHSTGLGNEKGTLKLASEARSFVKLDDFNKYCGYNEVIGHTRHATQGARNTDNAHPYIVNPTEGFYNHSIVGTHNGWLINHEEVAKRHNLPKHDVDSYYLFSALSLASVGDEINFEVLNEFDGAMSISLISNGHLYLYRRESKPLFIGRKINVRSKQQLIYYSSIEDALLIAGINKEDIREVPTDTVFKFKDGKEVDNIKLEKPRLTIPLDCLPSSWKTRAPEAKELYPNEFKTSYYNYPSHNNNHGTQQRIGFKQGSTNSNSWKSGNNAYGANKLEKEAIVSYHDARYIKINIVKEEEDGKEVGLENWVVSRYFSDTNRTQCSRVTNDYGIACVPIYGDLSSNSKIVLAISPPMSKKKEPDFIYFTPEISSSLLKDKGGLLEVVCYIPFRDGKPDTQEPTGKSKDSKVEAKISLDDGYNESFVSFSNRAKRISLESFFSGDSGSELLGGERPVSEKKETKWIKDSGGIEKAADGYSFLTESELDDIEKEGHSSFLNLSGTFFESDEEELWSAESRVVSEILGFYSSTIDDAINDIVIAYEDIKESVIFGEASDKTTLEAILLLSKAVIESVERKDGNLVRDEIIDKVKEITASAVKNFQEITTRRKKLVKDFERIHLVARMCLEILSQNSTYYKSYLM